MVESKIKEKLVSLILSDIRETILNGYQSSDEKGVFSKIEKWSDLIDFIENINSNQNESDFTQEQDDDNSDETSKIIDELPELQEQIIFVSKKSSETGYVSEDNMSDDDDDNNNESINVDSNIDE
tara:strand:+ start:21356 stop:21730 length:375 start_codon:yes stop_codon:yes gene_type:complete